MEGQGASRVAIRLARFGSRPTVVAPLAQSCTTWVVTATGVAVSRARVERAVASLNRATGTALL